MTIILYPALFTRENLVHIMIVWLFTAFYGVVYSNELVVVSTTTLVMGLFKFVRVRKSLFFLGYLDTLFEGLIFSIRVHIVGLQHVLREVWIGMVPSLHFVMVCMLWKLKRLFWNLEANKHTLALHTDLSIFVVGSTIMRSMMFIVLYLWVTKFVVSLNKSFST